MLENRQIKELVCNAVQGVNGRTNVYIENTI